MLHANTAASRGFFQLIAAPRAGRKGIRWSSAVSRKSVEIIYSFSNKCSNFPALVEFNKTSSDVDFALDLQSLANHPMQPN